MVVHGVHAANYSNSILTALLLLLPPCRCCCRCLLLAAAAALMLLQSLLLCGTAGRWCCCSLATVCLFYAQIQCSLAFSLSANSQTRRRSWFDGIFVLAVETPSTVAWVNYHNNNVNILARRVSAVFRSEVLENTLFK